ncbi:MAG: heterodisulfide reductase subunit A, partial [Bacteroidetes bacterium]|nr:heterodisulfide reductase subunit A [Bacteroidota bacterium]
MEKKIGLYICSGCEIGNSIDISLLEKVGLEYKVHLCKSHPKLCQKEAGQMISQNIDAEKLDGLVVAACSPRVFTKEFAFEILTERV